MPLNPSQTRQLLENLAHRPNKKLGQNFLIDGNIVRKSLELADLASGQAVVEIGPGLGTLTRALLESGHPVWAVERDASLADYMRRELAPDFPDLHLIEGDCLDYPRAELPEAVAATGYQVVANLPYAVSTPWMDALLAGPLPERMVLMLQRKPVTAIPRPTEQKTLGQSRFSCNLPTPSQDGISFQGHVSTLLLKSIPSSFVWIVKTKASPSTARPASAFAASLPNVANNSGASAAKRTRPPSGNGLHHSLKKTTPPPHARRTFPVTNGPVSNSNLPTPYAL